MGWNDLADLPFRCRAADPRRKTLAPAEAYEGPSISTSWNLDQPDAHGSRFP
jgi:hypothetical protein